MLKAKLAERERAVVCTAYRLRKVDSTRVRAMTVQQIVFLLLETCGSWGSHVARHVGHTMLAYDVKVSALTLRVKLDEAGRGGAFGVATVVPAEVDATVDHNAHLGAAEVACG